MKKEKRTPAMCKITGAESIDTNRIIACNNRFIKPFLKKDELLKLGKEVQS
jgi:hypothetical protein